MAEKMGINGALEHGQAQAGDERIFHLLPNVFGVRFFVFHSYDPSERMRRLRETEIQDAGATKKERTERVKRGVRFHHAESRRKDVRPRK